MKFKRNTFYIVFFLGLLTVIQMIWWAYLITSQQDKIGELTGTAEALDKTIQYHQMIFFEGLFFVLVLTIGLIYIYRSYKSDLELQRQKESFVSAVTHELKTPIANIRLCFETLERPDLPGDGLKTYTERGLRETDRLYQEIDSILKLNESFDSGPSELEDLNSIFKRVIAQFPNDVARIELPEEGNLKRFKAPHQEMELIIKNLLSNALKFSTETVVIGLEQINGGRGRLTIKDSGKGFTTTESTLIKKAFYQAKSTSDANEAGTGLGLTLSERIARKMNFKIDVKSDGVGTGATAEIEWGDAV